MPEVLFGFLPYPTSSVALAGRRTRIVMVLLIDDLAVFNAKCVEDIEVSLELRFGICLQKRAGFQWSVVSFRQGNRKSDFDHCRQPGGTNRNAPAGAQ